MTAADYAGVSTSYAALVNASLTPTGWLNSAVSGTVAHQWVTNLMGLAVASNEVLVTLSGMNDMRSNGDDATKMRQTYRDSLGFLCGWLAAPPAGRYRGADMGAFTGSWTAGASYPPFQTNRYSATPGDSCTFTLSGTRLLVGMTRAATGGGLLAVRVNGSIVTNIAQTGYTPLYLAYASYGPQYAVLTGLTAGATVRLEVATNANTYIEYVVMSDAGGKPALYLGNCLAVDTNYYGGSAPWGKTSSNAIDSANAAVLDVATDLRNAGLAVTHVDAHAVYTPDAAHRADWLHPNNAGHAQIAAAFTNAIAQ